MHRQASDGVEDGLSERIALEHRIEVLEEKVERLLYARPELADNEFMKHLREFIAQVTPTQFGIGDGAMND